jgi:hypothetical protein
MCEHCLDYDYPAFGGCCGWHADDHCRAGSAFCGMHGGPGFAAPHDVIEVADPVPEVPYDSGPSAGAGSVMTPPATERPPADLAPPPTSRPLRPSGNGPLPPAETPADEAPALPDLELPSTDDAPIPDPLDR